MIVALAHRAEANVWSDERRQLTRERKQFGSPVASGRATGAYKLRLEGFPSGSRPSFPCVVPCLPCDFPCDRLFGFSVTHLRRLRFKSRNPEQFETPASTPVHPWNGERRNAYRSANRLVMGLNIENEETCLLARGFMQLHSTVPAEREASQIIAS